MMKINVLTVLIFVLVACGEKPATNSPSKNTPSADSGEIASQPQSNVRAAPVIVYAAGIDAQIRPLLEAYGAESKQKVHLEVGVFEELFASMQRHGNGSSADLLIADNIGDLWQAVENDLYRPVYSPSLDEKIPAALRDPEQLWRAIAFRAQIVVYNPHLVSAEKVAAIENYASLGDAIWSGKICLSSSTVPGNRSLIAFLIRQLGKRDAELLVRGWQRNLGQLVFAQESELLQAIAKGQCSVGIVGSHRLAFYLRGRPAANVAPHWFATEGQTHIEVTAAGVTRHAENPQAATALLEWMTTEQPAALFAALGLTFPANPAASTDASIDSWRVHVSLPVSIADLGYLHEEADKLAERAHYD